MEEKHGVIVETPTEARQAEPGSFFLEVSNRIGSGSFLNRRLPCA